MSVRAPLVLAALAAAVAGPAAALDVAPSGALSCSGCHAAKPGPDEIVPRIAGRPEGEIATAMRAFRTGDRDGTVMPRIARGFTEEESGAIAAWLSRRP